MDERIAYKLRCKRQNVTIELLQGWLDIVLDNFTPTDMRTIYLTQGKFRKFNEKKIRENLIKEMQHDLLMVELSYKGRSVSVVQNSSEKELVWFSYILCGEDIGVNLENFFERLMEMQGIVAYKCPLADNHFQNEKEISHYELMNWSLHGVKTKFSTYGSRRRIIDIEYNPGHFHIADGIWFGSCYRMWFGKEFYQYISKEKLQSFANCYENCELENEVTRITLYENMWDYAKEENRQRQWNFRRSVGMDEVAHALEEEKTKRKVTDSEIEIQTGNFSHGGVRLINQYFDDAGNIVCKSKAKKVKTAEYSADGKIIFSEEKEL